jgi:UDP-N-acetylmuramate dehydrogenase
MSYDMTSLDNFFQAQFPGRAKRDEPLAAHSSAGVGGPADFFVELQSSEEAEHLIYFCVQSRIPLLVIGNGSNLLFTDQGVRGIVASMGSKLYRLEEQQQDSALVVIDAGMTWADLVREMAQQGWGGLEFGAGIPGTLGGAIVTNAGAHNEEIGRHVQWVEVLDARGSTVGDEKTFALPQLRRYTQAELQLGNRKSRFREQRRALITSSGQLVPAPRPMIAPPEIILRLAVSAYKEDQQHIEQRLAQFRGSHRREIGTFAGHVGPLFKDPLGMKASQVIEQAGRKGLRRGKVQVSARNANFLVNLGGARASEMTSMIVEIHQQVLSRMGIDLEVDIELYGA